MSASVKVSLTAVVLTGFAALLGCQAPSSVPYPATIRPVAFLVERIVGSRMSEALVHPGRNPETYDPSVADLLQFRDCRALFYVSPVLDGWAANFKECQAQSILEPTATGQGKGHTHAHGITLLEAPLSPESIHDHGAGFSDGDPHFWTDPHRILEVLPRLERTLVALEPESENRIREEVQILGRQLEEMESEAARRLAHLKGKRAVLMHPTYRSFLEEHGLVIVAVVEPTPGKELSVLEWRQLLSRTPVDLIIHERQLPMRPARILAKELNAQIVELDPMGAEARNLTELLNNQLSSLANVRF
ncbi:MAG: zinc ABC transporter substrate-binding protein [Leptospiraceae bacterium]|nr:zinc ABC transporter substrate-binding protein [Leptospiraceae bacterium]